MKECVYCGKKLFVGEFGYKQNTCYDCFCRMVGEFIFELENKEHQDLVKFLYECFIQSLKVYQKYPLLFLTEFFIQQDE